MEVSVVIVTKNQKILLQKSLPILLKQELKGDCEIIVVDSESTDGAREFVKSLPVKLIEIPAETFRFSRAFNIGAKHAKGKYLVRLSGDAIPTKKNFLMEMIRPFKDKKVGGTYGRYVQTGRRGYSHPNFWSPERFLNEETRFKIKPGLFKTLLGRDNSYITSLTSFAGGCCAIRRETWEKRPFNENLLAAEDAEYAIYLHLKGFDIVYNPKAWVIHEHKIETLNAGFWGENIWRLVYRLEIIKLFLGN